MFKTKQKFNIAILFFWATVITPMSLPLFVIFFKTTGDNFLFFFFYIEAILMCLFLITYFRSKFINIFAIPTMFLISLIVIPQITTNYFDIHQDVTGMLVVFAYLLFWSAALGIILVGIKSILEKKSIYYSGPHQLSEATESDAITWGIIYLIIGLLFLLLLLSFTHAVICEKDVGVCYYLGFFEKLLSATEKLPSFVPNNPIIILFIIGSIAGVVYKLFQKRK